MSNIFTMTTVLAVLVVAVLLPECYGVAITDTDCSGDGDCTGVNSNSACDGTTSKCACVANYRQNPTVETECVTAIGTTCTDTAQCSSAVTHSACDTTCKCDATYIVDATSHACVTVLGITCSQTTECSTVANSGCIEVSGSKTCTCNDGYKTDTNMCTKVLTSTCTANTDCSTDNAECTGATGSMTCACKAGYGGDVLCALVLGSTCANDGDCTDLMTGTECVTTKCQCSTMYTAEDNICKTALGQTCVTDTTVCVSNAGCADTKCACNADFMEQDRLCAASAQSVGISAGVLLMSMLAMAIQKLC